MPGPYPVRFDADVEIKMRDGTMTKADVFRPDSSGGFPTLLSRTPYDKSAPMNRTGTIDAVRAAARGYSVVIQDVRGRYTSDGPFNTFFNEIDDGYDSVEWVASQPWSSGKVGMFGVSYVGATQWLAAKAKPPSLAGLAPGVTAADYHEGWAWQGGAFELGFNLSWSIGALGGANFAHLAKEHSLTTDDLNTLISHKDDLNTGFNHMPMKDVPSLKGGIAQYYYDWLAHPEYDEFWKKICIEDSHSEITVPAFNFGGWHDIFLGGTIRNFTNMRQNGGSDLARSGQRLVIGPWIHGGSPVNVSGEYNFGTRSSSAAIDLPGKMLNYYDHILYGEDNGFPDSAPVEIFVMGENVWRSENEWPLERAQSTKYYLHSNGKANSLNGNGSLSPESPGNEPPDTFAYNPMFPVPTAGGGLCCDPAFMANGAFDQRNVEAREDVLVYSTPPLETDVEVTGPIVMTLYASSSAVDTDFTAKLVDVEPSGYARNLTDGIIRARYRNARTAASFIAPGTVYEYTIDLWATSNLFKKGHQIRLEVSSSNFPRFDRNTNTGEPIGESANMVSALQTILHSAEYPSHVTLPIVHR